MHGFELQRLQHQHVERALKQIASFPDSFRHPRSFRTTKGEYTPFLSIVKGRRRAPPTAEIGSRRCCVKLTKMADRGGPAALARSPRGTTPSDMTALHELAVKMLAQAAGPDAGPEAVAAAAGRLYHDLDR